MATALDMGAAGAQSEESDSVMATGSGDSVILHGISLEAVS